jgi:hypothetical protein
MNRRSSGRRPSFPLEIDKFPPLVKCASNKNRPRVSCCQSVTQPKQLLEKAVAFMILEARRNCRGRVPAPPEDVFARARIQEFEGLSRDPILPPRSARERGRPAAHECNAFHLDRHGSAEYTCPHSVRVARQTRFLTYPAVRIVRIVRMTNALDWRLLSNDNKESKVKQPTSSLAGFASLSLDGSSLLAKLRCNTCRFRQISD